MEQYRIIAGNSGVTAYEIGPDYITIRFSDSSVYRYTYASTGQDNLERMNGLA